MPKKPDQLVVLFTQYRENDLTPDEMAHHFRTELKLKPHLIDKVDEDPQPQEKRRSGPRQGVSKAKDASLAGSLPSG